MVIQNNTDADFYFYYYLDVKVVKVKVKARSSYTLSDLSCYNVSSFGKDIRYYDWAVSYELFDNPLSTSDVKGFGSGAFNVPECKEKILPINN